MNLVFDSIGPPTNPHMLAPAQATRLEPGLPRHRPPQGPVLPFERVQGLIRKEKRA